MAFDKKYYFISYEETQFQGEEGTNQKILEYFENTVIDEHPFKWQNKLRVYDDGKITYTMKLLYFTEITFEEYTLYRENIVS